MHFVRIDTRRGVKISGLWYGAHSPILEPHRAKNLFLLPNEEQDPPEEVGTGRAGERS